MPDETPRIMTPDEVRRYLREANNVLQNVGADDVAGAMLDVIATVEALWSERDGLLDVDALSDMEIWDLCREHHGRDDRTAAASFRRACRRAARLSTSQAGEEK